MFFWNFHPLCIIFQVILLWTPHKAQGLYLTLQHYRMCRQGSRTQLGLFIVQFWELLLSDRSPAVFLSPNHKLNSHQKQRNICCLQEKKSLTGKITKWTSAFSIAELHTLPWRWVSGFLVTHHFWHQVVVHFGCSSHTLFQLCSALFPFFNLYGSALKTKSPTDSAGSKIKKKPVGVTKLYRLGRTRSIIYAAALPFYAVCPFLHE